MEISAIYRRKINLEIWPFSEFNTRKAEKLIILWTGWGVRRGGITLKKLCVWVVSGFQNSFRHKLKNFCGRLNHCLQILSSNDTNQTVLLQKLHFKAQYQKITFREKPNWYFTRIVIGHIPLNLIIKLSLFNCHNYVKIELLVICSK